MEEYEFQLIVNFRGTVVGFSKKDAWDRLRQSLYYSVEDFDSSHLGYLKKPVRVYPSMWKDGFSQTSRSDQPQNHIVLPDNMDWLP